MPACVYPSFATHAVSFTSLTVTPAVYLRRLLARFHRLGGQIHRVHLESLKDALTYIKGSPRAIVVCAGIGALHLGGVADEGILVSQNAQQEVKTIEL